MAESTNTGGRKPRVTDEDLLDVFRATSDPVLSTAEVADAAPIKRRGVLNRLRNLEDAGELESKQIGGRNTVWWLVEESSTPPPEDPPRATRDAPEANTGEGAAVEQEAPHDRPEAAESGEEILRELDLPGQGAKLDGRINTVLQMYEHLQAHAGEAVGKGELLEHVDEGAVGYASLDSFWNNFVKANTSQGRDTNALVALPGVEEWGRGEYRYTEP